MDDVLKDITEEDLQPLPDPKWKKPVIIFLGILFVLLIAAWPFTNELNSFIRSEKVSNNVLVFSNSTISFEGDTLQQLVNEFSSNQDREIKACLFGNKSGNDYVVTDISFPEVIRANVLHVMAISCPVDTLIDLHSHPINNCIPSDQDLRVFAKRKESNPNLRMMVMCSRDRFTLA